MTSSGKTTSTWSYVALTAAICMFMHPAAANQFSEFTANHDENDKRVVVLQARDGDGHATARSNGFFVGADLLVTTRHSLRGANSVTVHTSNGKKYVVRGVVSEDERWDVVVLKVDVPVDERHVLKPSRIEDVDHAPLLIVSRYLAALRPLFGGEVVPSSHVYRASYDRRKVLGFGNVIEVDADLPAGYSGSPVLRSQSDFVGMVAMAYPKNARQQPRTVVIPASQIAALTAQAKRSPELTEIAQLKDTPRRIKESLSKARHQLKQGQVYLAEAELRRAANLTPTSIYDQLDRPAAFFSLARLWKYLGDIPAAKNALQQAARLDAENLRVQRSLSLLEKTETSL